MKKRGYSTGENIVFIAIVVILIGLLSFVPAWIVMTVWNYLAVAMSGPEINIWIAWLIVMVAKMIMPSSK